MITIVFHPIQAMLLALLSTQIIGCTPIRKEIAQAVVRQIGDVPCFTIEDTEKTRAGEADLEYIQVIDEQGEVWSTEFKKLPPLTPDLCIPYGKTTDTFPPRKPAQPLVPGHVYGVSINAPMKNYRYEAFSYDADFCLIPSSGTQKVKVHQIQMDMETARWRREACKLTPN